MIAFIRRISASLAFRIIAIVVTIQICMLGIALYNENQSDEAQELIGADQKIAWIIESYRDYADASAQDKNAALAFWQEVQQQNPDLWYYHNTGSERIAYGNIPDGLPFAQVTGAPLAGTGNQCATSIETLPLRSNYIARSVRQCGNGHSSEIVMGGASQDYQPLASGGIVTDTFVGINEILISYSLLIIGTSLLIYLLIRPIRAASRVAMNITAGSRGAQIPTKGLFSEVRGLVEAINSALGRLDGGYERERRLRNAMAHELRTPLTILRARIEEIEDSELRKQVVGDIAKMKDLIARLLEFARTASEAEKGEALDLADMVQNAALEMRQLARSRDTDIAISLPNSPVPIFGNPAALSMAVSNILSNAIRHSDTKEAISVSVESDGSVTIRDQGKGMDPDLVKKIFEPFIRGENMAQKAGYGLGMALVSEVVAINRGQISIDSTPGAGTTVKLQLPVVDTANHTI